MISLVITRDGSDERCHNLFCVDLKCEAGLVGSLKVTVTLDGSQIEQTSECTRQPKRNVTSELNAGDNTTQQAVNSQQRNNNNNTIVHPSIHSAPKREES